MKKLVKRLKEVLSDTYRRTIYAVTHMKENPAVYIRDALFGFSLAVIVLNLIISIVLFAVEGGYSAQIAAITGSTSGGIDAATRTGNRVLELFRGGVLWNVSWALIVAQVLFLIFTSFWKGNLAKRIILVIDLIFALILGLCAAVYQGVNRRIIQLPKEQEARLVELFQRSGQTIYTVFFALCAAAGIFLVIVALLNADGRTALKYLIISIAILYLVCPAILLLAGNIIPLIVSLVLAAIIGVVFCFTVSAVTSGGDSSGHSGGGNSKVISKPTSSARPSATAKPASNIKRLDWDTKVRKVRGYQHDYVECYTSLAGYDLCSLSDLRSGKFVIYDANGRRLSENDIPWK